MSLVLTGVVVALTDPEINLKHVPVDSAVQSLYGWGVTSLNPPTTHPLHSCIGDAVEIGWYHNFSEAPETVDVYNLNNYKMVKNIKPLTS
jgi:hypothetical protein